MSKYCTNCGAKMEDSAKICGMCGTWFNNAPNTTIPPVNFKTGLIKSKGNVSILYIAQSVLFIILGILNFSSTFKVEVKYSAYWGLETGYRFDDFTFAEIYDDWSALPIIIGILIFASAIISLLPLFITSSKKLYIFTATTPILSIWTWMGAMFFLIENEFKVAVGGWFYLLICIAIIALSVLIAKNKSDKN